jgi:hypothetical protein
MTVLHLELQHLKNQVFPEEHESYNKCWEEIDACLKLN